MYNLTQNKTNLSKLLIKIQTPQQFYYNPSHSPFSPTQSLTSMSIYSGFATRQQQQTYDQLVEDVIFVMQKRILKFYNKQQADQNKFLDVLIQLHQQMAKMEENKYLEPRTSRGIQDLLRFLLTNVMDQVGNKNNKGMKANQSRNGNHNYANTPKFMGNTAPLLKNPQTASKQQHQNDSFIKQLQSRVHEPTSIGKIIKQFHNEHGQKNSNNNSLGDSRNTFINPKRSNNEQLALNKLHNKNGNNNEDHDHNLSPSARNPQQQFYQPHHTKTQNLKQNKTETQFKSRFKSKDSTQLAAKDHNNHNHNNNGIQMLSTIEKKQQETRDNLLEYLQKNNKNYLRGYRKRQVKSKWQAYSKEHSGLY